MPGTPVLHFSGRFRYDHPEYNNDPTSPAVPFDPKKPHHDVMELCGCNPSRYFEFKFEDVRVTQTTYRDGSTASASDPVIGQPVDLNGFLVDVSPSSINARLVGARMSIGTTLKGRLDDSDQSAFELSIRPLGFAEETIAAHYETCVPSLQIAAPERSRYFSELGAATELEIYFQVNRWTPLDTPAPDFELLSGDVYGYLRPRPLATDSTGLRLSSRLLLTHPDLDISALGEFVTYPDGQLDLDGTYDLMSDEGLVALRYLDFIPFMDRCRKTPDVIFYLVSIQDDRGSVLFDLGSFRGDLAEMRQSGGLVHFALPAGANLTGLRLVVEAVKMGRRPLALIREPEWSLKPLPPLPPADSHRDRLWTPLGVVLPSGGSANVRLQVFRQNRPAVCHPVRWIVPASNGRSPMVDCFADATGTTDADGIATVTLKAHDFYSGTPVYDPVTSTNLTEFPFDRYYGNPVVAEIDNPDRYLSSRVEQSKIAVRVLHEIRPEDIPAVPSFKRDVRPLFSCQTRYFPWLHVRDDGTDFQRFLDLDDFNDFSNHVDEILRRLALDESDPHKMPRSRDFPFGGADLIRKWKYTGMSP